MVSANKNPVTPRMAYASCCGVLLFAACSMLAPGCAANPSDSIAVSLDENFDLRVGQSALLGTDDLTIGFEGVSADSRCGKGDVCVWEGDAAVDVALQIAGTAQEVHQLHTNARFPNSVMYKGFSVRLVALLPQPLSGRPPATEDYVAVIQVTRGLSGYENIL